MQILIVLFVLNRLVRVINRFVFGVLDGQLDAVA